MRYSDRALILSAGVASAAAIDRFMADVGRGLAGAYAPDGQYVPPPAGLGATIIAQSRAWGSRATVNHDLVAAQICHETAGWQSEFARHRNNPAGLGAINSNPGQAIRFPTPEAGIQAQVAHLLVYALGTGAWADADPRYEAVRAASWLGTCRVWRDLGGKWSYPGTTYGESLATLANRLMATHEEEPTVGRVTKPPMNTDHRSPNMDGYAAPRRVEAAVQHIANGTLAGTLAWFANPDSMASSNYLIDDDGTIYEIVPPDHSAWTNGAVKAPDVSNPLIRSWVAAGINPNLRTVTIEHVGQTTNGSGGALTAPQLAASQHLNAWLAQEYGYPADRTHLIGHYQIDSLGRSYCPGFSAGEWDAFVAGVAALLDGDPPADDGLVLPGNPFGPHPIRLGFRAWCETQGRARNPADVNAGILSITGYPMGPEYATSTGAVQEFERLELVYTAGATQPWDIVVALRGAPLPPRGGLT